MHWKDSHLSVEGSLSVTSSIHASGGSALCEDGRDRNRGLIVGRSGIASAAVLKDNKALLFCPSSSMTNTAINRASLNFLTWPVRCYQRFVGWQGDEYRNSLLQVRSHSRLSSDQWQQEHKGGCAQDELWLLLEYCDKGSVQVSRTVLA